jgi:hypothetical protein
MRRAAMLALLVMFGTATAGAQSPAPLSAVAIYDRACSAVAARGTRPFIEYIQSAAFVRHGHRREQRDRIILRMSDGKTNVTSLAGPQTDARVEDRPLVFPTSTFGLVPRTAAEKPSAFEDDAPATGSEPPVIGRVRALARDYDPTLTGTETIAGASVYHLVLVPRFDPRRNRIRALFVDTVTFEPRRIVIEYFAERGPLRSRPTVTFDYTLTDGTWTIARGSLDFTVRFGPFAYGGSGELRIDDVSFPRSEPDWMFDRTLLADHRRAATSTSK